MKKQIIYGIFAALLFGAFACSKDKDGHGEKGDLIGKIVPLNSNRMDFSNEDGKGIKLVWSLGDEIELYTCDEQGVITNPTAAPAATLLLDEGAGSNLATFRYEGIPSGLVKGNLYKAIAKESKGGLENVTGVPTNDDLMFDYTDIKVENNLETVNNIQCRRSSMIESLGYASWLQSQNFLEFKGEDTYWGIYNFQGAFPLLTLIIYPPAIGQFSLSAAEDVFNYDIKTLSVKVQLQGDANPNGLCQIVFANKIRFNPSQFAPAEAKEPIEITFPLFMDKTYTGFEFKLALYDEGNPNNPTENPEDYEIFSFKLGSFSTTAMPNSSTFKNGNRYYRVIKADDWGGEADLDIGEITLQGTEPGFGVGGNLDQ